MKLTIYSAESWKGRGIRTAEVIKNEKFTTHSRKCGEQNVDI
ncbi:MAG TPA: hypothetical protein VK469_14090 [Candidatus Kapabacteria bacterium]|nr:hypothetical protein [Candidatus Kapabacteria bacterium]